MRLDNRKIKESPTMKKNLITALVSIFILGGCQQSMYQAIHPSMPLKMRMLDEIKDKNVEIIVFSASRVSQKVGEGQNVGESMGEVLLDKSPKEIVINRIQKFSENYPQKASKIESCEIKKFSSFYKNEVVIWAVYSEVDLSFKLKDDSIIPINAKKDCKSITFSMLLLNSRKRFKSYPTLNQTQNPQ